MTIRGNTGRLRPVEFKWALDEADSPVPIELARRGMNYRCPLCRGPMIARLGAQVQHHYSHDVVTDCTPEGVSHAALRRWIAIQLGEAMIAQQAVEIAWPCADCGNTHRANLLSGVSRIAESYREPGAPEERTTIDVALLDSTDKLLGAILVQGTFGPTPDTLRELSEQNAYVITIPVSATTFDLFFYSLLAQGHTHSGPCPLWAQVGPVIRDGKQIVLKLREAASGPKPYFYAPVEQIKGINGLVNVGGVLLWLTPPRWEALIGGDRNPLGSGTQVFIREWPQPDGVIIYLFFVIVRESCAVGVRRYHPGSHPMIRLDERFRKRQATALDIAHYLVTH